MTGRTCAKQCREASGWRAVYGEEKEETTRAGRMATRSRGKANSITEGKTTNPGNRCIPKPPCSRQWKQRARKTNEATKNLEDDALRQAMKDCGIGTPATRASIIETIIPDTFRSGRGYMERCKKSLVPTEPIRTRPQFRGEDDAHRRCGDGV